MDIQQLISEMTLEDKVLLVSGASSWRTHALPRLTIPAIKVSDGPNGVRGDGERGSRSTAFPVGVCLASSWNQELIGTLGAVIATEARQKGVDVVLGPTINLQRTPLGGRNFECYSEDPILTGTLAVHFIRGLQDHGVGACPKHFVCNDSEFQRFTISAEVDPRTLREVYLRPFEMAVTEARPWTIMAAYNRINGTYACSHDELLNGVLRDEWGFDGLVISDWFAARETVANALGGLDLEMPGPATSWGQKLLTACAAGEVPEATLDAKVERLLRTAERVGRFDHPEETPESHQPLARSAQLARELAVEGMVLIRNNGVLPLAAEPPQSIALIGPNAITPQIMGGGSSQVAPHHVSLPAEALRERYPTANLTVHPGVLTHKYVPAPTLQLLRSPDDAAGLTLTSWDGLEPGATPTGSRVVRRANILFNGLNGGPQTDQCAELRGTLHADVTGRWTFGLAAAGCARMFLDGQQIIDNWTDREPGDLFFGAASSERRAELELQAGHSYDLRLEYRSDPEIRWQGLRYGILPPVAPDLFEQAITAARSASVAIVVVGTNLDWETEGNDRQAFGLPGDQDALVRAVLEANDNTVVVVNSGAPVAMPWLDQAGALLYCWFPGQEFGRALTDLLSGDRNPSGRMPVTAPQHLRDTPAFTNYPGEFGKVRYGEGLFVGYRWYDRRAITPAVPFGHGLSYTTFDYGPATTDGQGVTLAVTNSGDRAGQEVIQVYLSPLAPSVARPVKWLGGFTKVALAAGATATARITLDSRAFDFWNPETNQWVREGGHWRILIGASSRDIRQELSWETDGAVVDPAAPTPFNS